MDLPARTQSKSFHIWMAFQWERQPFSCLCRKTDFIRKKNENGQSLLLVRFLKSYWSTKNFLSFFHQGLFQPSITCERLRKRQFSLQRRFPDSPKIQTSAFYSYRSCFFIWFIMKVPVDFLLSQTKLTVFFQTNTIPAETWQGGSAESGIFVVYFLFKLDSLQHYTRHFVFKLSRKYFNSSSLFDKKKDF